MVLEPCQQLPISVILNPRAFQLRLNGANRNQVLQELVNLVPALANQLEEQQALMKAVVEREEMHSTGIGDGVALPHTRNTLGGVVKEPVIAVGRHLSGVAFGAIDGKPVHLLFLLLATSITQHLDLLARMSRLLRHASLREALMKAATPDAFIRLVRHAETP